MAASRNDAGRSNQGDASIAALTLNPTIDVGTDVQQMIADEKRFFEDL